MLTHARGSEDSSPHIQGADCWAPPARKSGANRMKHCTPTHRAPAQPREAKARARGSPATPRTKAPPLQALLIHKERAGDWFMLREAIKQSGEIINTSCQFTYSFFFNSTDFSFTLSFIKPYNASPTNQAAVQEQESVGVRTFISRTNSIHQGLYKVAKL